MNISKLQYNFLEFVEKLGGKIYQNEIDQGMYPQSLVNALVKKKLLTKTIENDVTCYFSTTC